ncbi:MAG: hypothetical protein COB46_12950 [Rhodospirillaceae bacterium]|nr:MAG: hypothetical protein COB46_12950 [Rhodospirillaceae bacterium]
MGTVDLVTTDEDTILTFTKASLLLNDTDIDGDVLTISSLDTTATQGQVTDNGDGTFSYDPGASFHNLAVGENGMDSFNYVVSDGNGGTSVVTVSVSVSGTATGLLLTGTILGDTLTGQSQNDTLAGGLGNDVLIGGGGADTYALRRGDGQDVINNVGEGLSADKISYTSGVNHDQLWFSQSGNNLVIQTIGTTDQATVTDWYTGSVNHVASIQSSDGFTLSNTMVQNLVAAMAGMTPPPVGQTNLNIAEHTALDAVIASNWQ